MKKTFLFVTTILIIMVLCCCLYKSWLGKRPCDQPNTNWATKDKAITFSIDKNGSGNGKMVIDGETVDIHIAFGPATQIDVYPIENVSGEIIHGNYIEHWIGDFNRSYKFTATVKKTTYFEADEKITFYRVDD